MNESSRDRATGIVAAALVGAAVGAGVALLFAPCSGKETRAWLSRSTREVRDRATTAFEKGKEATLRAAKELTRDPGASAPTFKV